MTVSLGVLLSGGGTTLENLLRRIDAGTLDARVVCVVSTRPGVRGLSVAEQAGVPAIVVPRKRHDSTESFSEAVTAVLDEHGPDLMVMAGFLSLWLIPERYRNRVINIHPALIPSFSGKGFYGGRVHKAVAASGVKLTGCTVHFADNVYDHGPIILQRTVPVFFEDTPEDIAKRVFVEECEAYPEAVRLFGEGRLRVEGDRVRVLPA